MMVGAWEQLEKALSIFSEQTRSVTLNETIDAVVRILPMKIKIIRKGKKNKYLNMLNDTTADDSAGQNTSRRGILYVLSKLLGYG